MTAKMNISELCDTRSDPRNFQGDPAWVLPRCNVGIELEYEGAGALANLIMESRNSYWNVKNDDSLRNNGKEFVFISPLCGVDLTAALEEMRGKIAKLPPKTRPVPHYRTSVHVHMNMLDVELRTAFHTAFLGYIFEPALFRIAGQLRSCNNFSMGIAKAAGYAPSLGELYHARDLMHAKSYFRGLFKYSAINLLPLATKNFGTIEFRHHEGTLDMARIGLWVNLLMCLKRAAVNGINFSDASFEEWKTRGLDELAHIVFGEYVPHILYNDLNNEAQDGLNLVQDIMHHAEAQKTEKEVLEIVKKKYPNIKHEYEERHVKSKARSFTVDLEAAANMWTPAVPAFVVDNRDAADAELQMGAAREEPEFVPVEAHREVDINRDGEWVHNGRVIYRYFTPQGIRWAYR